jgi:hypothetical protein
MPSDLFRRARPSQDFQKGDGAPQIKVAGFIVSMAECLEGLRRVGDSLHLVFGKAHQNRCSRLIGWRRCGHNFERCRSSRHVRDGAYLK